MSVRLSYVIAVALSIIGGGLMIIPYLGIPLLSIGVVVGVWALSGHMAFRRMTNLIDKRIHTKFIKANFDAIGMSSPYVDFYFNIHSCLSYQFKLTGSGRGELWNPYIEAWRSNWEVDTEYQDVVLPDTDTEIRVRWNVPQGHHSPMTEFAFRARDKPPIQNLTFEDMHIELEARFLRLKNIVGWLQLSQETEHVEVPNHPVFDTIRKEYLRARSGR